MELRAVVKGHTRTVGTLVAGAVVAGAIGVLGAVPAQAAGRITLTDQGGRWSVSGAGLAPARSDVQVWVMKADSWTTLEHQAGLSTTRTVFGPRIVMLGGYFSAKGRQTWFSGSGILGPHWSNDNPLRCGQPYQAVVHDAVDGYVYSNVVRTACPVIN